MKKHLWEAEHQYYCNLGNYWTNSDVGTYYKSFQDFLGEWSDADFDYNLLFRWDWVEGEENELPAFNGDVSYRNGQLRIFWMGQRKGTYCFSIVDVCRADELAVKLFLQPRLDHLMKLWAPLKVTA